MRRRNAKKQAPVGGVWGGGVNPVKRIRTRAQFSHVGGEDVKLMSSVDRKIDGNRYPRQMIPNELSRCSDFNFTKQQIARQIVISMRTEIYNVHDFSEARSHANASVRFTISP